MDVDLKKLTESSKLLSSDFEPLPSLDLISQAVEEQKKETQDAGADANSKRSDEMLLTSLTDNITAVDQRTAVEDLTSATPTPTSTPTPTASPSPGEFSPPPTIASPNPYVITSSSVIKTDPSITTNGNTDFGTIYRDPEADGNRAQWLFGSVSEFDEASGFNSGVDTSTFLNNIAVFKFTNLQLSGDPTIDISNNGLTSLGLVGVNALSTNAPPGTTFHFNGIHTLLLATQDGPLTLGTGVSFSGTDSMFVYARGEGSALTLASNVTTNNDLRLYSEGAANLSGAIHTTNFSSFSGGNFTSTSAITAPAIYINSLGNVVFNGGSANAEIFHVSAGGDLQIITPFALNAVTIDLASNGNLTWSGGIFPATTTNSNAGVSASANGTLHITGNLEIDRSSGDANGGMNVFLRGEIGIVIDGSLTTDLVPSLIDTGGSTQLNSDNDITIAGALSFNTEVRTNLSSGGDISVIAGGAISANSITANIKVDSNYSLGRADLSFFAEGNMTTNGGMNFAIDDSVGGKINGDASLMLIGNNISTNGNPFNATINNNAGTITGSTSESIIATGMFNAGDLTLQILNSDVGAAGTPGSISGLASILLNTVGSLSANSFTAIIDSRHRGSIESAASIEIGSQNGMTIAHDFQIGVTTSSQGSGGGKIGSEVSVGLSVDAGDGSVGGFLTSFIATNGGGRILGDALMQATVEGNLSAHDGMLFTIEDTGFGNPGNNIIGGQIRGEASVSVQAQNILTTSDASGVPGTDEMALEFSIYSNVAGTIGGDALVSVGAVNRISAPGTIFFTVANGNYQELGPGAIGGNASINVSATDLFSGDLFAEIYNYEGASIGGSATVSLNLSGVLNASGDARLTIDNHAGRLTNGGSIQLTAASISANSFKAIIDNSNEGQMPSASIVTTLNGDATSTIVNDANFQIFGAQTPTSAITFNGGNYSVGGTFLSTIDGNGTLAFNNTSIAADVIKAGIFGANGALRIGGGTISADTILRLYAPGSSGLIEFVANTTLSNTSAAVVLAANTVTIDNNVRVTISGPQMALVYTSNANYTGSGGNGSTTGMFVGNGATTHPLSEAPPFDQTNPTQTIVYTGAANGNWSNASVWDPSVVPNNSNGQIYNASIASGFLVQDIFGGVTIETLFVSGGTLRLDNQLTLNAGLNFSGGTISSGPIAGGVLNIAGSSKQSAQMGLNGVTIHNSGIY
ncbi:MAG: beta strand repeat-containing protein, partial [Chthoniobacterales bacterium]